VSVFDGSMFDLQTITVNVTDTNDAPVITSNGGGNNAIASIRENLTFVTRVVATDQDPGTVLTYSITGGADGAAFQINPTDGTLAFKLAPDYERPTDSDHD